jgi:glycerate kinase
MEPGKATVVVAPDKFKGSLTAVEVAYAVADGLLAGRPDLVVRCLPVADGGDGTLAAAEAAGFREVAAAAQGPTGEPVRSAYARRGTTAIVELAQVVGLNMLPGGRPDPLGSSTYGLGLLMGHALEAGCRDLIVAVGGSASTDGGAGMLQALGVRLLDAEGCDLPPGGGALPALASVDLSGLHPLAAQADIVVASDVDNPLLGPLGAAAVYAPQKGATAAEVALLETGLARWSGLIAAATGRDVSRAPGAGAAGGTAFGAMAVLGGRTRPGVDLVLDFVGFGQAVRGAALVVTGEGSLDRQSLRGKAPIGVAARAGAAGVPVVAVAGRCLLSPAELAQAGIRAAYALSDLEPDPARRFSDAAVLLRRLGGRIAREQLPEAGRGPRQVSR